MRKNILISALAGLCVVGLTACSKGEDKPATEQNAATLSSAAPTQQATQPADANQAQPTATQTTASMNNSNPSQQPQQQPENNQVVAADTTSGNAMTAPASSDTTTTTTTTTTPSTTGTADQSS